MSMMPASTDPTDALQAAIRLAQSGDRDAARTQLLAITAEHPTLELAWMWLATVTDDVPDRITVLRRVLAINPANAKARAALVRLTGDQSSLPPLPKGYSAPRVSAAKTTGTIPQIRTKNQSSNVETILIVILIVVVVAVVLGGGVMLLGGRLARPTDTPTATITPLFTATRPIPTPARSYTPSITPGGPTDTPYVQPTLPPSWTPVPSQTSPATFTPIPTDTLIPTETTMPTLPPPTAAPTATKTVLPTLPPIASLPATPK